MEAVFCHLQGTRCPSFHGACKHGYVCGVDFSSLVSETEPVLFLEAGEETEMETCDEGYDKKPGKEEGLSEESLPAAKVLPVDASGDIMVPHETTRQPKHAVVSPLRKSTQAKKED